MVPDYANTGLLWSAISVHSGVQVIWYIESFHYSKKKKQKRKGTGSQKDSQIYCGQFISKIARKSRVLTDEDNNSLCAPIESSNMFMRASMQDLYERMGSMEIRHETIDRMEVLITHLVMLSPSTTSTTSTTSSTIRSSHHNNSMMMRRTSSVG
ncbi:hypothetical protein Tco_1195231 [Tanacetum coccineum]